MVNSLMSKLTLQVLIIWKSWHEVASQRSCCSRIELNGEVYDYVDAGRRPVETRFRCFNKCVYTKLYENGTMYCFRFGGDSSAKCIPACACGAKGPNGSGSTRRLNRQYSNRIVNGDDTTTEEWPWYVYVIATLHYYIGTIPSYCGGSLVSEKWVVTAAHCLLRSYTINDTGVPSQISGQMIKLPSGINISLGVNHAVDSNVSGAFDLDDYSIKDRYPIIAYFPHPEYIGNKLVNDIALLMIDGRVDLKRYPNVCLPPPNFKTKEEEGWIIGHGSIVQNRSLWVTPKQLQEGRVKIQLDLKICTEAYRDSASDNSSYAPPKNTICVGGLNQLGCGGDSGGPFMVAHPNDSERILLMGALSYGGALICPEWFVYTEVSAFTDWIEQTMSLNGGSGARCY